MSYPCNSKKDGKRPGIGRRRQVRECRQLETQQASVQDARGKGTSRKACQVSRAPCSMRVQEAVAGDGTTAQTR